jgi:hypothetical protein
MTDSLVHAPTERPPAPDRSPGVVETVLDEVVAPIVTPVAEAVSDLVVDDGHDAGLGRALVLGGVVGFVVVYLIAFGLFLVVGDYEVATAAGVAMFVGLFGGVGFGAMVGASIH